MIQNYSNYTPEDFLVWNTLFNRQMDLLSSKASNVYLEAVARVGFSAHCIPHFTEVNALLQNATGWQLTAVPNIVPNEVFFPLLCKRTFTATTWLRKMSELDYLEEPDMFHDVFGHVPLLSHPAFCRFFEGMAQLALEFNLHPVAVEMLGRLYWFTVEFGLIEEQGEIKVYGAGICSSNSETKYAMSATPDKRAFDVKEILHTPFDNMRIQEKYFVIESFEQLFDSLPEVKTELAAALEKDLSRTQ